MNKFSYDEKGFLLNGTPFNVVAGAMHYFRVPREYWRDRLLKIKACGFNTVETYTAWNLHEPEEGVFDFSGNLDLKAYLELINELGMFAIVRPGPYICSEWEFGGFPWWLLQYPEMHLRCMDEVYLSKVNNYFDKLIPIIASCQCDVGGAVIMVQVENEYGSYGNDSAYLRYLADSMEARGINSVLFTSDGGNDTMLSGGTVPEILKTCNFGSQPAACFKALRKFQKTGPLMCAEYWNGWFDHWGEKHHHRSADDAARTLDEILNKAGNVSVYMMHGGTNFGFMNGANCSEKEYQPTVNSYDDDAPINEFGQLTEKYYAIKAVLAKHGHINNVEVSQPVTKSYGKVEFNYSAKLLENLTDLTEAIETVEPLPMEKLGQGYGMIYYTSFIKGPKEKEVLKFNVHDRAYVFIDNKFVGIQYRNDDKFKITVKIPKQGAQIGILVDNMGRTNYGPFLADKKGIIGSVMLGQQHIYHWKTYCLKLNTTAGIEFNEEIVKFDKAPTLYEGEFYVEGKPKDTFVKLAKYKKGLIWINGNILSRYWNIGPQKTAYLPGVMLKEGSNKITILELEGIGREAYVELTDTPDIG